jgi:hypothetical protein
MNIIKVILIAVAVFLLVMLGFSLIGIVYSALWYLFWIGVLAVGGYAGYKLLTKGGEKRELEDKTPIAIAEIRDADRALEEYKRKRLSK